MNRLAITGLITESAYPTTCDNAEFLPDGAVRPRKNFQQVVSHSNATPRGAYFYKGHWYIVAGSDLLRYHPATNTTTLLATGISGSDRAHFVPFESQLLIRVSDQLYLVNDTSATRITRPAKPSTPTTERVLFEFNLDTDLGGSATYTSTTDTFTLADVADNEPGAHRYLKTSYSGDAPKRVGEFRIELRNWTSGVSLNHPASIAYYENVANASQRRELASVELPYPYRVGIHRISLPFGALDFSTSHGFRFHVRHNQTYAKRVLATNTETPRRYKLTVLQSGFESEAVDIPPPNAGIAETENYFVKFTNLPAGTWRLYREDSAGIYRLVHEGTGTTYTDYKSESELGDRYYPALYPTSARLAIEWQRRAVLAEGNRLYISEAGAWQWGDDSEMIVFPESIIALANLRGVLYVGCESGWYRVIGWKETLMTMRVSASLPASDYVGELLMHADGTIISESGIVQELRIPNAVSAIRLREWYILTNDGKLYLRFSDGRWSEWTGDIGAIVLARGNLYTHQADGLYTLDLNARVPCTLSWTVLLDTVAQLGTVRVEGVGTGTLTITGKDGNRTVSGNLPLVIDRVRHNATNLPITLTLFAGFVSRVLVEFEPRLQKVNP